MPAEPMNISFPPQMARFIRSKVKAGYYADAGEVVRDAVRRLKAADAALTERELLESFETHLAPAAVARISRGVKRGIADIEAGRFQELDADGLRGLAADIAARSAKNSRKP
jgi:putative addiction module CopG family antidote